MGPLEVALLLLLQAAPREEVVDVPGEKLKLDLVHVPVEGSSLLPYAIAKYETIWAEFRAFHREDLPERAALDGITRPSLALPFFGQLQCPPEMLERGRPVIGLRRHAALAYADWLTARTGRKFRLPTELEWEHAARAGRKGAAEDAGWHRGNSGGRARVPGTSTPNAWGLHDMLGNVTEQLLESREPGTLLTLYRGGAWNAAPAGFDAREDVRAEWFDADPLRPRSSWWWTGGFHQGLRVVCVGEAAAMEASKAYAPKLEVKVLKDVEKRHATPSEEGRGRALIDLLRTVTVELRNGGDQDVVEAELQVYFLDVQGRPHLQEKGSDNPGRPNYNWAHPVLAGSAHASVAKPLAPGESRVFSVDLPETTGEGVDPKAFGARVTWVRLKQAVAR